MYSNAFIETFRRDAPYKGPPYLDCDTTPSIRSRYAKRKTPALFKAEALALADTVTEGQIGVYDSLFGGTFYGYAIKYPGQAAYFEEATEDA